MKLLFKISFLIIALVPASKFFGQNIITIKKKATVEGLYQIEKTAKQREYIFFDSKSNVIILNKKVNRKRALGIIQNCIINDNCKDCKKTTYDIEKNETIVFGFKKKDNIKTHFSEYRGKLSDDKNHLTLKISNTDMPVIVKNYFLK